MCMWSNPACFLLDDPRLDSEQGGLQLGDGAALFVYEILWWDRICGSWWNKSWNKKKWAPVGNGKQLSRREACTHVCWLFTLGCDTTCGCIPALTVGSPDPDPHFHARLKRMFMWEHRILYSPDILRLKLFLCYIRGCITFSDSLTARGPSEVVTRIPHPISVSKQLTQLLFSRRQRVCRRLRCNQNSWENRIFYMQNKQCGGNKTFRRAVRSFQESIWGLSSASQPLPGNYPSYFMPPSPPYLHTKI